MARMAIRFFISTSSRATFSYGKTPFFRTGKHLSRCRTGKPPFRRTGTVLRQAW